MSFDTETLIVGAGLSGLTAAFTLHQEKRAFIVLEAGNHAGGLIHSTQEEGFLIESGPHTFPSTATELLTLCTQLNLQPRQTHCKAQKRYLYLNGCLTALSGKPLDALTTPILSLKGKLRALQEPFQPKHKATDDVSVARFLAHRLGREVVENLVDPFISGIYAGNVEELSLPAVFPKLWEWEQQGGSLFGGARQAKKSQLQQNQASSPKAPRGPMKLLSFVEGLEALPNQLVKRLPPESVRLRQSVTRIEPFETGYRAHTHTGEAVTARSLIIATPAYTAARLLEQLLPQANQPLSKIPYNGLAVAHLGFQRNTIPHALDGFGCLVPGKEKIALLGSIWASSLFPDRAPEGQILLSNFIGGGHHPEISGWPPETIEQQVLSDLTQIFKPATQLEPTYSHILAYQHAIPQYNLGHREKIQTLEHALQSVGTIQLCGNYLHGIALNECVKSGTRAAKAIISALG